MRTIYRYNCNIYVLFKEKASRFIHQMKFTAMKHIIFIFTLFCLLQSCISPPEYPKEPIIEYVGLNKKTIRQGSFGATKDSIIITFSYTDGDGNIGAPNEGKFTNNIFFTDSRDGFTQTVSVPFIPNLGIGNGISGEVSFQIFNLNGGMCCIFNDKNGQDPCTPSKEFPTDTLTYTIYIVDQDGNESNRIETEPITILCN